MTSRSVPSKGRNKARRKARIAARMGLGELSKAQLDAMHAVSLKRFRVGIGVVVQEETRHQRTADSLRIELDAITGVRWWAGLLWPFSRVWRLRREELRERELAKVWNERLRIIAEAVARRESER